MMKRIATFALSAFMAMAPAIDAVPLTLRSRAITTVTPVSPGSTGFKSTCSTVFSITNLALQSQTFTNATWAKTGTGVAAPTITANTQANPVNGSVDASTMALPAVSGAGNGSFIAQTTTSLASWSYTTDIYVKGVAGGESLWLSAQDGGANFTRIAIVATTSWQRVSLTWLTKNANQIIEIGVDLRDGSQSSKSAQSVYIWGAQLTGGYNEWTYIPTTTGTVTATQTLNCPAATAFRDFTDLTYSGSNPIIPQATASYNNGGTSNPYLAASSQVTGTIFGVANCTESVGSGNRDKWYHQCLYYGPDVLHWTNLSINPIFNNGAGLWDDQYLLHGTMAPPATCSLARWCYYYSATNSGGPGGTWGIGIAAANDPLNGPWTKYVSNPLSSLLSQTSNGIPNPGLPTMIQIGSTLFLYTVTDGNNGKYIVFWTSPVGDGLTWTFRGTALPPATAADWDFSCPAGQSLVGVLDPGMFRNKHGFYEMAYTQFCSGSGFSQRIGYAISADGILWFRYQAAPIVVQSSSAYPGTFAIGDSIFYEDGTTFSWLFNYDDGISQSQGSISQMTDY